MKPIGYLELVARFRLEVLPPASGSFLLDRGRRRSVLTGGIVDPKIRTIV